MRRRILISVALVIGALSVQARAAEVHVNVNIGTPPPIVVRSAPTMVYLAEPGVYAAVGIPYDVYFVSGRYYYNRGNNWFWGPGYGGPWTYVEYRALPRGIGQYRVARLHEFREREYKVYRTRGPNFHGRYFVADYGPSGRDHGNGHRKH
jgi:hypothetical protein